MIAQVWEPDFFSLEYLKRVADGLNPHAGLIFDLRDLSEYDAGLICDFFSETEIIAKMHWQQKYRMIIQSCQSPSRIKGIDDAICKTIESAYVNFIDYRSIAVSFSVNSKNFKSPVTMGIINVTPDSFSDGGKYLNPDDAFELAAAYIESGIDIIDIGGESSRPGSEPVSAEEEIIRIIPLISKITAAFPGTIISVDTTKSIVAEAALDAGAGIVNDISGGLFDDKMLDLVSQKGCPYIIMHMKGTPKNMQLSPEYEDVITEVYDFLYSRLNTAKAMGITDIIIDPGIGFGKRLDDNINLIKGLSSFKSLGAPILVGLSRKSFLGKLTGNDVDRRDTGSVIAEAVSLIKGARIIRTHNAANARELKKLFTGMMIN